MNLAEDGAINPEPFALLTALIPAQESPTLSWAEKQRKLLETVYGCTANYLKLDSHWKICNSYNHKTTVQHLLSKPVTLHQGKVFERCCIIWHGHKEVFLQITHTKSEILLHNKAVTAPELFTRNTVSQHYPHKADTKMLLLLRISK